MGPSQITEFGAPLKITVLQQVQCLRHSPCAQVHRHHHITARHPRPVAELVQAKLVALHHLPCQIHPGRAFLFRPHAILPTKPRDKVSAGITDNGYLQLLHQLHGVLPKSLPVRKGTLRLINALVYGSPQVLDKRTVHPAVDGTDDKIFVNDHFCFFHMSSFLPCIFRTPAPSPPRMSRTADKGPDGPVSLLSIFLP